MSVIHSEVQIMKRQILQFSTLSVLLAGMGVLASCNSAQETKPAPTAAPPKFQSVTTTKPGVAGGSYEETYTVEAIVTAVDQPTRRVTLKNHEGDESSFTADPEIKNLPQLHAGDKVTVTFGRRLSVTVESANARPISALSTVDGTAPQGQKPGALVAADITKVARVTAIDTKNRTADLQFVDRLVKNVPVRSDVDLARYKVGDNVVIQVTAALMVIAESPKP